MNLDDPENGRPLDPQRYQQPDPRTREEVGGILERAFQREGGREPDDVEIIRTRALLEEAESRFQSMENLAREAEMAAKRAEVRYGHSQNKDDLESALRWQQEAALHRREVQTLREEIEKLRKHLLA